MKRGFLNNDKGKKAIARNESPKQPEPIHDTDVTMEDATLPSVSEHSTSTQKMDTTATSVSPDSHDHSGGICDCLERAEKAGTLVPVNLHKAPPGMLGNRKQRRFVFRSWPRNPNGKVIHGKMTHRGKETAPWLEIWGETLYDFYKVCRIPGQESLQTLSSSSRLAAAMKELGELDAAKSELDWAEKEGDPHQVFPFSLKELVTDYESRAPVGDPNADDKLTRDRPILEDRLPFHLLPEKLIVHDPWDTLSVCSSRRSSPNNEKSWANMTDIVREYKLDLSSQGAKTREDDRETAKKDNSTEKWRQIQLLQSEDSGRAVNVLLPPRGKPLCVPEAHLYIRKEDLCGTGNHSIVYKVELEMPRAALIDEEVLCESCFREAFEDELNARRKAGTLFPPDAPMGNIKTEWVSAKSRESFFIKAEGFADARETEMVTKSRQLPVEFYVGPTADVRPPLKHQNLARGPLCEHLAPSRKEEKPEMIRVVVCAKLSLPDDRHLEREAANYQAFPRRFFEHWNGYQLVYPLHDPTPAGAVVPQFYGYYVPAEAEDEYRSPIMLLELCGKPIEMEELNYDERSAAAALYFYLQDGGWIQQSVAPRNIVMQPGPISTTRKQRKSSKPSFRLIDFGRAHAWGSGMDAIREKEEVLEAFRLFDYA